MSDRENPSLLDKVHGNDDHGHYIHSNSIFINMLAGAMAGVCDNTLFYPLDTAKTRMQDLSDYHNKVRKSVASTLLDMMKEEGITSPYRGFAVTILGSAPAHGAYFASYELTKSFLEDYVEGSTIKYCLSGATATLAHDGIMVPTETVKQRLQVENSPYKTFRECIVKLYKSEGMQAFYRSYGTQLVMNIPFQTVQFTTYELMNEFLNPGRPFNPFIHATAGAIAGGFASAVTTPLDVCKTLLNTQKQESKVIGIRNAIKTIYEVAGPFGYFRGISARVLFVMPSTAICWGVYESLKFLLNKLKA